MGGKGGKEGGRGEGRERSEEDGREERRGEREDGTAQKLFWLWRFCRHLFSNIGNLALQRQYGMRASHLVSRCSLYGSIGSQETCLSSSPHCVPKNISCLRYQW